ncbi:MAG: hypothetical protein OWS74_01155 [Firmicutes bacterium]|nr:hypothetical protein [Bacillota bacterium]
MRVVTFAGNLTYIDEVVEKNKVTDIYVDKSFHYPEGRELHANGANVHLVDTGIPPSGIEVIYRRLRIAKMLLFILEDIHDNIFFVDSDVIVENMPPFEKFNNVTPLCIPAILKPTTFVGEFCYPTTFYMPAEKHDQLEEVVKTYIENTMYVTDPVDIFIHSKMGSVPIRHPGVCHYIRGEKVCLR